MAGNQKLSGGKASAARLAALWCDDYEPEFFTIAETLLKAGDQKAINEALRLVGKARGSRVALSMSRNIATIAEVCVGDEGETGFEIFAVAVAAGPGKAPSPEEFGRILENSRMFPEGCSIRMAPGWLRPGKITDLDHCGVNRLMHLVDSGRMEEFSALHGEPFREGISVIVGLSSVTDIAVDDKLGRSVIHDSDDGMEEDVDAWRAELLAGSGISVAVRPACLSLLASEIEVLMIELEEASGRRGAGSEGSRRSPSVPSTVH